MNVLPPDEPIDPRLWERPQARAALARHDVTALYRLLHTAGIAQRRIAQLTGQSQSEISEIVNGRQVQAYDVLSRIADGLSIPRGYMGLAYADLATKRLAAPPSTADDKDGPMERRAFLGLVSKLVMGASLTPSEVDLLTVHPEHTPQPRRVGATEVTQLRALTAALRRSDNSHGGGSCRDAILAEMHWAESLLSASCADQVRPDLLSAVADLKTLAGWTAHDLGLASEARAFLAQAVATTREAGNHAHTAIVLHHLGRVPLDNGDPVEALKLFQLGQIAAQDSHSCAAVAILLADEALAYAQLRDPRHALTALRRAEDEFAYTTPEEHPEFLRFFNRSALDTNAARVLSALGLTDAKHREDAVARLNQAIEEAPADRVRQSAFNLIWLATCALADNDVPAGTQYGVRALDAVRELRSKRILDHLRPLHVQALGHSGDSDTCQLAHEIRQLRAAA